LDDLTLKVNADFSSIGEQFKQFSDSLGKYSDIPLLQEQLDKLIASYLKLAEASSKVDSLLSSSKGIKSLTSQINAVNRDTNSLVKNALNQTSTTNESSTTGASEEDAAAIKLNSESLKSVLNTLKSTLKTAMPQVKENESIQKIESVISEQDNKILNTKKQISDEELKRSESEKNALQQVSKKQKQQSVQSDMQKTDVANSKLDPNGSTKKGMLYQTPEQLQQDLSSINKDNGLVDKLANGFKEVVQEVNNQTKPPVTDSQVQYSDYTPSSKEKMADKVNQEESTIRYNQQKQNDKEEQQNLESIYKIQERISKLKTTNINADQNTQKYNEEKISRLSAQEKSLIDNALPENVLKAQSNKSDLESQYNATLKDSGNTEQLKKQNEEYKKSTDLVKELIRLETELAKNPGLAVTSQLNTEKSTVAGDLARQRVNLSIDQRSDLDMYQRSLSVKPAEATARTEDTQSRRDAQQVTDELELQQKKLVEINNYLGTVDNKISDLRKNFGNFIDEPKIKAQLDKFKSQIESIKTTDPTTFNRSSSNNELNAITASIKTSAGDEGLTNSTTMYNKLIALIREESTVKLQAYKIDGDDNGLMNEKLKLIQQQIAEVTSLLDKYAILNNSQTESLNTEKQKASATFDSNKAMYDNSVKSSGQGINENLVNPTNQFYSAFNKGTSGAINSLNNFQSKLYSIRYAFEGMIALAGGQQLYQWLIGANAQIETLQKSMEVTMHSASEAQKTIQQLRSYATLTPFLENETFQAGESLSANKMDVMKWTKISGDLAAAKQPQGVELNDVVNVVTRINAGDFGKAMIRLRQMGISLSDFRAEGLKFSKNNTFLGTTDEMLTALEKIVNSRFGGMTSVLGNTVSGSISTIKDYFKQIGIDLGGDLFNQFSASLQKWKKDLRDFRDSEEFKQIISNFNKAFNTLKDFILPLAPILKTVLSLIVGYLPEIATLVKLLAGIKIAQGAFKMFDTLQANMAKINEQYALQKALITNNTEADMANDTVMGKMQESLAKIIALRKLGLTLADETTAADAVAAGNLEARGVNFAKENYTKSVSKIDTESELGIINAGGVSKAKMAESAAAGSLAGVGAEAEAGGAMAGASVALGMAALAIPIVAAIVGGIRQATASPESLFTSEDYKRMSSEQSTDVQQVVDINTQRQTAKAQIDYYQNALDNAKGDISKTQSIAEANPNNKDAQNNYDNALHANAEALNGLTLNQQQLTNATQQILDVAPELSTTLIDQNGSITDNTGAFDKNTQSILANIDGRKSEIAKQKQEELQAANNEADKAKQQIDENNFKAEFSKNNQVVGIAGAFSLGIVKSITDLFGGNKFIDQSVDEYALAGQSATDKKISVDSLSVDNNKQNSVVANAAKLQADYNQYNKPKYYRAGTTEIDWTGKVQQEIDRQEKNSIAYLKEDDGVGTRATEITDNGATQLDRVKDSYQVKLNDISKAHGNKTDSDEYKAMQKMRDDAVTAAGQEILDELQAVKSSNDAFKGGLLKQALGSKINNIAQLMKDHPTVTVEDIQNAMDILQNDSKAIITGKLHDYQETIRSFFNLELGGNKDNLNEYIDQLNDLAKANDNDSTIQDAINKAQLKMDADSKDAANGKTALQSFNDEWERKRQTAEDTKEISIMGQEMNNNLEGTQAYKDTKINQDNIIRGVIKDEIAGLNKLLASNTLSDDDTWAARKQIADLQKEANTLALEIDDKANKNALSSFHEGWDNQNSIEETKRDLALQQDELSNYGEESTKYLQDQKSLNLGLKDKLLQEASGLKDLIPQLDSKDQLDATLQMLNLQKEANQIMIDIKKNTDKFGEFNKPSFVKAMTYYDYMTQDSQNKSIEIGNAEFAFKIDSIKTTDDVKSLMTLIQDTLGKQISNSSNLGVVHPNAAG